MKPLHARTSDFYKTPTVRQQCCSCFFPRGLQRESRKMTELRPLPPSSTDRGGGLGESIGSGRIGSKAHLRELRKGSDKSEPSWMIDGPIWCLLSSHGLNCISLEQAPRAIYARQGQTIENIYTRLRDKCQFVHRNAETKDLLDTEGLDDMRLK